MKISGYVPFYNNAATVVAAVESLQRQQPPLDEVFAIDDGSTDNGIALLETTGVRVLRQPSNLGRGAARARAMREARHALVLCCDATNILPPTFAAEAQRWFDQTDLAAVFGLIKDPRPVGTVARWRARHLFKAGARHTISHRAPLITFGTMIRAAAAAQVGGYLPALRHSEDLDLGQRLLAAGYDVVADPNLSVFTNIHNTLPQVLERYWRWYAGKDETYGFRAYLKGVSYAVRGMAVEDLRAGDPLASGISLMVPHYQLWRYAKRRFRS